MSNLITRTGLRGCQGQAATEFTIVASFVLIPLFLLIPLVGKYLDIKQACVQEARFEAWEYTAWFHKKEKIVSGLRSDQKAGNRELSETQARGSLLFFSDITDPKYGMPGTAPLSRLNPLWVDHHGGTLFNSKPPDLKLNSPVDHNTPDPTKGVINKIISLIDWVTDMFGRILKLVKVKADFDALNSMGYFISTTQVSVRNSHQIVPDISNQPPDSTPLTITAKASVLARGWTAGSTDNANSESRGLVLTSFLSPLSTLFNGTANLLQRGINIAKHVLPINIRLPHGPQFGHVKDDLMPYEHLHDDKRKAKGNDGLYYYAEE